MSEIQGVGVTPIPGWYADPSGAPRLRWWDGADWTEYYHDRPSTQPELESQASAASGQVEPLIIGQTLSAEDAATLREAAQNQRPVIEYETMTAPEVAEVAASPADAIPFELPKLVIPALPEDARDVVQFDASPVVGEGEHPTGLPVADEHPFGTAPIGGIGTFGTAPIGSYGAAAAPIGGLAADPSGEFGAISVLDDESAPRSTSGSFGTISNYGPAPQVGSLIGGFPGQGGWTPDPIAAAAVPEAPGRNPVAFPALILSVIAAALTILTIVAGWPAAIPLVAGGICLLLGIVALRRAQSIGGGFGTSATTILLSIAAAVTSAIVLITGINTSVAAQTPNVANVIKGVEASTIADTVSTSAEGKFGYPIPAGGLVCPTGPAGGPPNAVNTSADCTATLPDGTTHSVRIAIGATITAVTITWLS